MLDPFGILYIGEPRALRHKVSLAKQVSPRATASGDKVIQINNTHLTQTPNKPVLLMGFNWLPTNSGCDTRSC